MTRLTEALARAAGADREMTEVPVETGEVSGVIPRSWNFDRDELGTDGDRDDEVLRAAPERKRAQDAAASRVRDITDALDAACASLPAIDTLVVGPNANKALVEEYRHVAAALHHAQLKTGARTVMVASAVQAEGKTTTAANLALTLSHSHQRRVLLIDADLRRPSIHTMFQLSNQEGLSDTLRDVAPDARVPLHKLSPTLSVITAGHPTQDPMSALVSAMMKQFVEEAADQYDWVVLDTPPVALLSDANLLAAMIDVAVLVVSANTTPYPLVRRAVEAIGASKVLGVVLNRAQRSDFSSGYGYYKYGYSYSSEPVPAKKRWALPFRRGR